MALVVSGLVDSRLQRSGDWVTYFTKCCSHFTWSNGGGLIALLSDFLHALKSSFSLRVCSFYNLQAQWRT